MNQEELFDMMIDALEFYACQWRNDVYTGPTQELLNDGGQAARDVLDELYQIVLEKMKYET